MAQISINFLPLFLSDSDRGSDLESAIWQFVVVVVLLLLLGAVRSEFIDEL